MPTERDINPDADATLRIEWGRASLAPENLQALRKGSIVILEQAAGDPVDIYADARLVARGEIVTCDGKYAVRIVEIASRRTTRHFGCLSRGMIGMVLLLMLSAFSSNLPAQTGPAENWNAPRTEAETPLTPPKQSNLLESQRPPAGGILSTAQVVGSLAVVLGIFFLATWLLRRALPAGSRPLPAEALEVLGRGVLSHRQQVQLLRCGNKLLLASVSASGIHVLTEITEPSEVERLTALCRSGRLAEAAPARQASPGMEGAP